jgi:hypothetical protein
VNAPRLCPGQPRALGLCGGHARELADGGPGELPGRERSVEGRKPGEDATDAQALLGLARVQPEHPLGVLAQARVSGAQVDAEAQRRQQPAADLTLVPRALLAEREQPFVHARPVGELLGLGWRRGSAVAVRQDGLADDEPWEWVGGAIGEHAGGRLHASWIPCEISTAPLAPLRAFAVSCEVFPSRRA